MDQSSQQLHCFPSFQNKDELCYYELAYNKLCLPFNTSDAYVSSTDDKKCVFQLRQSSGSSIPVSVIKIGY